MKTITPGIYTHYKSDELRYEVLGIGRSTETEEEYVVYKPLYSRTDDQPEFWVRPYEMFMETVEVEGKTIPRFKKVA